MSSTSKCGDPDCPEEHGDERFDFWYRARYTGLQVMKMNAAVWMILGAVVIVVVLMLFGVVDPGAIGGGK